MSRIGLLLLKIRTGFFKDLKIFKSYK